MAGDRTIFDEPHYQSLELLAARALADGDLATAFKFADRRCRILPAPEPHCFVLRAEAAFQMDAVADALSDLSKAIEIDPQDIAANRRLLTWARGKQQLGAARRLIGRDRDFSVLRKAIEVLRSQAHDNLACVTVLDETIEGWAVWNGERPLELSIIDESVDLEATIQADAFHPLGEFGNAASFCLRRPRSDRAQSIVLATAGTVFHTARAPCNDIKAGEQSQKAKAVGAREVAATVIIPIYADYEATRLCLKTLLAELNATSHRAVLINDATPDARIAKYLAGLAGRGRVELLVNDRNLGFVGSVNRALRHVREGDVVILNSDTIVPRGFVDRLATAARLSADIGTVTPLSNNGEFTSFPIPNVSNPLPSHREIARIDATAAAANADCVIDIPSGIGFCLYVTRACLDAVGLLTEDFGLGYLEDADFCLRARERGFRNVCAASVYVGHVGSRSFGSEKRALVARNLTIIERRFPSHRRECAAFMSADPLLRARQAIERTLLLDVRQPTILVTGLGAVGAIARERACSFGRQPVIILEVHHGNHGAVVKAINGSGGIPQSLEFMLSASEEDYSLAAFLRELAPRRVEFIDPANTPFGLVELLIGLGVPYDVFIADAGLLGPVGEQPTAAAVRAFAAAGATRQDGEVWRKRWREIANNAINIRVPCAEAEALAQDAELRHTVRTIARSARSKRTLRNGDEPEPNRIGFVPLRSCAQEQWLIQEVARALSKRRPDVTIAVVGTTLDDRALMRRSGVFVTGPVHGGDFERVVTALGLGRLFVPATRPLFAHPTQSIAHSLSLPVAYFDWSKGRAKSSRKDLPIDPDCSFADLVGTLDQWMQIS